MVGIWVGKSEILDFERSFAGELAGSEVERDFLIFGPASAEGGELLLEHLFADVTLADERGVGTFGGAGALDELFDTLNLALLFGDFLILGGFFFGIEAAESGIITVVKFDFVGGFVKKEGFIGDGIKESLVVGNNEDGAGVVFEVVFDERSGLGVEVVGRLIEKQEAGVLEKDLGEGDFGLLAAGEVAHFAVKEGIEVHFLGDFK